MKYLLPALLGATALGAAYVTFSMRGVKGQGIAGNFGTGIPADAQARANFLDAQQAARGG